MSDVADVSIADMMIHCVAANRKERVNVNKKKRKKKVLCHGKVSLTDGKKTQFWLMDGKKNLHLKVGGFEGDQDPSYQRLKKDFQIALDDFALKEILFEELKEKTPVIKAWEKTPRIEPFRKKVPEIRKTQSYDKRQMEKYKKDKARYKKKKVTPKPINIVERQVANLNPVSPIRKLKIDTAKNNESISPANNRNKYTREPQISPTDRSLMKKLKGENVDDWSCKMLCQHVETKTKHTHLSNILRKKQINGETFLRMKPENLKALGFKKEADKKSVLDIQKKMLKKVL
eukprot:augustus_masked-scaffold_6-processed-gene-3.3-mRNA-1 protein AED:1.00 eAED:1.00 QI:0/-1/0/0/-1/1/1/0/287